MKLVVRVLLCSRMMSSISSQQKSNKMFLKLFTLQEGVCWLHGHTQISRVKVYRKMSSLDTQLQSCSPKDEACYWALTTVDGKSYHWIYLLEMHILWKDSWERDSTFLSLKNYNFHLSFSNVLHDYCNTSLSIKEAVKYWSPNCNTEEKIWVEFPMTTWDFN